MSVRALRLGGLVGAAGAAFAAVAAHAGPAVTSVPAVRNRWAPRLCGLGEPGHVALTFDDGPDATSTPQFLTALDRLGWTATFFLLGDSVRANPGIAAEVAAAGHEIALHGDVHRSHLARTPRAVAADIERSLALVEEVTGKRPFWFRPPYGILSGATLGVCGRLGLRPVLWTAWGRDWRAEADASSVAQDVASGRLPGGTVLLHDSDCTSAPGAWHSALDALPLLADLFSVHRLKVGPLAEHGLLQSA
ncbi:MAG TPA: polysaccharide deacetylase family protein [Sporichthyaceae bacterium]|jgi:peptidoglycan/xylan/chitin deacetylase (PgdA/CDA1 family)|nr:polysaccharide deacetylase family protein [Sporichthyaceae bacterium]